MVFATITLLTALAIEAIGSYVSVVGLSKLFAGDMIVILMAISLDVGKVVSVTYAYRFWDRLTWLSKIYLPISILIYMMITSTGVFGYLSSKFETAIKDANTNTVLVTSMADEQARLQRRKQEIDAQIAGVKSDDVYGRNLLIRRFGEESKRINDRLTVIDQELPSLKIKAATAGSSEVGPIMYVAEAFNLTPEQAVKYVIMMIMFVFDPMAVVLLIAANSMFLALKKEQEEAEPPIITIEVPVKEELAESVVEPQMVLEQVVEEPIVEEVVVASPKVVEEAPVKQRKPRKPRVKKEVLAAETIEPQVDPAAKNEMMTRFVKAIASSPQFEFETAAKKVAAMSPAKKPRKPRVKKVKETPVAVDDTITVVADPLPKSVLSDIPDNPHVLSPIASEPRIETRMMSQSAQDVINKFRNM